MNKLEYIPGDLIRIQPTVNWFSDDREAILKVVECNNNETLRVKIQDLERNSYLVYEPYIIPIKLTREILEKNGWNKRHDGTSSCDIYSKGNGDFYVSLEQSIYKRQEGFDLVVADSTYRFGKKIKYVHQLQHLLFGLGLPMDLKV